MGTITFDTDLDALDVIRREFFTGEETILAHTHDSESAVLAVRVDLAKASPGWRADLVRIYKTDGKSVVLALIVKHSGLFGRGHRSVSLTGMEETMGPDCCGGVTADLLALLSPLKPFKAAHYVAEWRARAAEVAA